MAKCKNCGKKVAEGLDFCSKECMEAYQTRNPIPEISNSEIERDLLDPSHMRGVYWRMAKLEAIHKARMLGFSDDRIMLILMRGGLTRSTAKRLMNDSKEVYGDGV